MQNQTNRDAISNFMKMTGASTVYLYGGAAIDRYLNPEAEIMDYDIAIQNPDEYVAVVDKLKKEGFDVGNTRVAFNLSTVAKHPKYGIFDLACMDIEKNGIYNLEKFYVEYSEKYPWGKAVDRFNTVHCLREGRIIPINNPDEEKAYDLLRRFSVLAGKYGFSLDRNGLNGDTIDTLHRRLQETPLAKDNEHSRVRCLARFMGAVLRSKKQDEFLQGMGQTELMSYAYPEINSLLHNEKFIVNVGEKRLESKLDLIDRMMKYSDNRDGLVDEVLLLTQRERDREDPKVINRVESFETEKTSPERLNKNVLNPLFAYILSGRGKADK